jgi:phosphoglycerate dehydrogenase-like enzyme
MAILALAKGFPALVEQRRQRLWRLPDARLVAGSELLLVGFGRIGREIARRAAGFDVRVVAVSRSGRASGYVETVVRPARLAQVARSADYVVAALPNAPGTAGLIDARVISRLRATAALINVGRPSTVDLAAVVAALRARRLRAALIDVWDDEPLPSDDPLWRVENLWVTPHCAYRFPEEEAEVASLFVENLRDLRAGRALRSRVDVTASGV